jgi:hypothetical protein
MSTENLIESIFEKVVEEKRNNTPISSNETVDLLAKSIDENDIELSTVEDNKDVVEHVIDPIVNVENEVAESEAIIKEEPAKETVVEVVKEDKKSQYTILCESLSKLICWK